VQYKVIIFDLDGTAIPNTPNGMPSKQLIQVINKAQSSLKLCAATGRSITNAAAIIDCLKLVDPCIISGGTQIVHPASREILWEKKIAKTDVTKVLDVCSPYSYELLFRDELLGQGKPAKERTANDSINVIYVMKVTPGHAEAIVEGLADIDGIAVSRAPSWTGKYIDLHITNSQGTKEHAIEVLLDMLHLSKEQSIGVGDGDNDVHLFKSVGLRIAMADATERLKSEADKIVPSVDEDGLAQVIEEYS